MTQFSERILNTPASFIREILKVIQQDDIISFAGGLPNPVSFPKKELKQSMERKAIGRSGNGWQRDTGTNTGWMYRQTMC